MVTGRRRLRSCLQLPHMHTLNLAGAWSVSRPPPARIRTWDSDTTFSLSELSQISFTAGFLALLHQSNSALARSLFVPRTVAGAQESGRADGCCGGRMGVGGPGCGCRLQHQNHGGTPAPHIDLLPYSAGKAECKKAAVMVWTVWTLGETQDSWSSLKINK